MIDVIAVDSDHLLLEGLHTVFDNTQDMTFAGGASTGTELMEMLQEGRPDIVTSEISLPDCVGLELIKDLHRLYKKLPILILSLHSVRDFAVRALQAGAQGYLHKANLPDELVTAVRRIVTDGKRYLSPAVAEQLALSISDEPADHLPHQQLSDRELEVFCLIVEENSVAEIAKLLALSPHTVHTYRGRIKEKMDLSSNVDMIRYALRHGLVQ